MRGLIVGLAGLAAALGGTAAVPAQAEDYFQETQPQFEACADGSLDRVRAEGIVLGESAIAPHSILDPNTKEASGIDVEINNAVLDWLGVEKRTIEWMPWESQIPSLLSGRTDVIAQNIHVNPERVKVISFTGPAWWYGPVVLVQKGNPKGIDSYDDFKDQTVGAISGSAAEAYLRRIGANTQPFKSPAEELQSLDQGRVDYVVEDDVIYTVFAEENPNSNVEALWGIPTPDDIIFGGGYGNARFGLRKEDCQLRVAYPTALAELRANGFFSSVLKKYGLSDRNLFWYKLAP
jgi:ABC-type amino acid transport substrate-binding protein